MELDNLIKRLQIWKRDGIPIVIYQNGDYYEIQDVVYEENVEGDYQILIRTGRKI